MKWFDDRITDGKVSFVLPFACLNMARSVVNHSINIRLPSQYEGTKF